MKAALKGVLGLPDCDMPSGGSSGNIFD